AVDGKSQPRHPGGGQTGESQQFLEGKAAVRDGGVGAPGQAALPQAVDECLVVMAAPQVRGSDAVIIDEDANFAAGQERQKIEERVELSKLRHDQVGGLQKTPAIPPGFGLSYNLAMGSHRGMEALVRFDENAHVGGALRKKGDFFGDVIANGIASEGVAG